MATKTISVRNEVDGVLTDLTACTLSDPGGTFGVRDVETGEVVVADGAAFTHDGTGLYSYVVTGLTAGREYLGETSRESVFFLPAAASETYSTDQDLSLAAGSDDVDVYADLNNNGDAGEIADRKAWARGVAYRWINRKLRAAGLTWPATAETLDDFASLADIEAERAIAVLYFSRGKQEQQALGGDGAMQWHYDEAERLLNELIASELAVDGDDATAAPGTFQFVPIVRGTAGDEYSSN